MTPRLEQGDNRALYGDMHFHRAFKLEGSIEFRKGIKTNSQRTEENLCITLPIPSAVLTTADAVGKFAEGILRRSQGKCCPQISGHNVFGCKIRRFRYYRRGVILEGIGIIDHGK